MCVCVCVCARALAYVCVCVGGRVRRAREGVRGRVRRARVGVRVRVYEYVGAIPYMDATFKVSRLAE